MSATDEPSLATAQFAILLLTAFAYFAAVGLTIPTLPRYVVGPLGGTTIDAGLVVAVFSVTAVAARLAMPRLARRLRPRVLLAAGALCLGSSSAALIAARTVFEAVGLRMLGGIGEALFFVTASAASYRLVPAARAQQAQSYFTVSVYAGLLAGPAVAETVRPYTGFPVIWWAVLGLSAGAAGCALRIRSAPEAPARAGARAFGPALLPGTALAFLTWGTVAFTTFVALYGGQEGIRDVAPEYVVFGGVVLGMRTAGARAFDRLPALRLARGAVLAATGGLVVLAAWPRTSGFLAGAALLGTGEALGYPALMAVTIQRAAPSERTGAITAFTGFFDAAMVTAALGLASVSQVAGFRWLYAVAAILTAAALTPLLVMSAPRP